MGSVNKGPQAVSSLQADTLPCGSLAEPCPTLAAGATLHAKALSRATKTYCPSLPHFAGEKTEAQRC